MPARLTELWRYPVKSMLREPLRDATVDGRGPGAVGSPCSTVPTPTWTPRCPGRPAGRSR
ncbi:hypothetical protein [Micromonospora sp. S-DT3-3-22]|uniref:hypothetical protein n=1 Tax=Micromonospora sp. S-DT3-3-22 TaxID=2755359 RepID=UPI00188EAB51|nr:hypothetical protein [Micromonospora sp. S-DT3-3-22]